MQILYTADALGNAGIEVNLITPPPVTTIAPRDILGHELSPNVQVIHLRDGYRRWLPWHSNRPFYRAATKLIAQYPLDAIYARNLKLAEHLLLRLPALSLVFETHEPFTLTYREEHPHMSLRQHHKLAALARREEFVYRHAHGLVAVPPFLIDVLRKEFGVETPAVEAPNGVDLRQAEAPARIEANPVPILLYIGSLHPWKGVETLVRALPLVSSEAQLHIAGGTPARIEELRTLARSCDVEDRVVFHGPVEPGKRFGYMHRADICLLPLTDTGIGSRHTSPIKLFEYMATGKPIVVADVPATRAIITPGVHALAVPVGDPHAFATAINALLADP
ncbi:MAG: glycosyltransferase family 4 protein, partial [Sulfuricaulis sp.]|nr:glycosyltransferase family 4 protein [Sulfuricaulis sp.]